MFTLASADTGAATTARDLAAIPSPSVSGIDIGPLTIHFYALCILLGVIVAVVWSERRWKALGGQPGTIMDMAVVAVPLGLVGGRLYHVISDYQLYFLPDSPNSPIQALYVWQGGLGIWGAIPLGALGVWLVARRRGLSMSKLSFAIAPPIALAQGIGRWGNYFNQELFGAPTGLPWALRIDPGMPGTIVGVETYHPTFLYESLWCVALAFVLAWVGDRFPERLGGGRLFALYVMGYTLGRFWIEYLRIDEANIILGFRLNNWTALLVFAAALAYFVWAGTRLDRFSTEVGGVADDTPGTTSGGALGGTVAGSSETQEPVDTASEGPGAETPAVDTSGAAAKDTGAAGDSGTTTDER